MGKKITMRKWVNLLITCAILWTFTCSCSKQPKYHPGGPYYYKTWANYYQPYRLVKEIQKDEVKDLEGQGYAYYIAFFDENGLISSFEKRYKGKMVLKVIYSYNKGRIEKEEITDESGGIKISFYDKNGEKIRP